MTLLSVNIDHIATIREARRTNEPDPVAAAAICELAGAHGITIHLRGDRRHIQHRDVKVLRETVKTITNAIKRLQAININVSLFIDPAEQQIRAALALGARMVELNTARYSDATLTNRPTKEAADALEAVREGAALAHSKQMQVLAGHGLTYRNVKALADIPQIVELNIGHNIVARAALVGLDQAVRDMLRLLS